MSARILRWRAAPGALESGGGKMSDRQTAWIFVSHASADLAAVREVRNHLESHGAAPLLFHLMALTSPEEFWPIIEREIQARSFFLYCESEAAERSEWVRRERQVVELARKTSPKRIAHVQIQRGRFDRAVLDNFLRQTIVFPIFDPVDAEAAAPFLSKLEQVGFRVLETARSKDDIRRAMRTGWTVIFLSARAMQGSVLHVAIESAKIDPNARLFAVLLDRAEVSFSWSQWLAGIPVLRAALTPGSAPAELVAELLERPFS